MMMAMVANDYCSIEREESVEVLLQGLMEFPMIGLSCATQITSHLWKRNRPAKFD